MKARKICYDKVLPRDLHRAHNIMRAASPGKAGAISLKNKAWINGSTIRIRFVSGTQAQKDMVMDFAPKWTEFANLTFEFTDDMDAEIRVAFDPNDGAWSYVGTDNLHIPSNQTTLNLGWQDEGVILHEFGHMIGLSHEHSNPDGGIEWNEAVVLNELAGPPNFWDEQKVRHNVLTKYNFNQIHGTEFDPDSVMLYAFPAEWTTNGIATHENEDLSVQDETFVASEKMYPGRDQPEDTSVELKLGISVETDIAQAGEQDVYRLKVSSAGEYTLQTFGAMDAVLSLFGPDSKTRFIAENDDGGEGLNSMLRVELSKGTYYAQVRHYSAHRTGTYRMMVVK
ncbi:MAG: M12 family metallopeptidase [Arenicellales bacterium]